MQDASKPQNARGQENKVFSRSVNEDVSAGHGAFCGFGGWMDGVVRFGRWALEICKIDVRLM